MTPRSIRRAAERKAVKRARHAAPTAAQLEAQPAAGPEASEAPSPAPLDPQISAARLTANRANAHLSTGPASAEGKAKSSLNAVTNALTGRTVLLPSDDRVRYERHLAAFFKDLLPTGARECELAQSLSDIAWRLNRIAALEMALYANGRREFADLVADESPDARPALLDMHTFLNYERQLRNLGTQESRLLRQREKQSAELKQLQQDRIAEERQQLEMAAKLYLASKKEHKPFSPAEFGFEFSIEDIEDFLEGARIAAAARETLKSEYQPQTRRAHAA
jgi:hypothetical protein